MRFECGCDAVTRSAGRFAVIMRDGNYVRILNCRRLLFERCLPRRYVLYWCVLVGLLRKGRRRWHLGIVSIA